MNLRQLNFFSIVVGMHRSCLLLVLGLCSCEKDTVPRADENALEFSSYVVESVRIPYVTNAGLDTLRTFFHYDENGVYLEPGLEVILENVDNMDKPFAVRGGVQKWFVDKKRLVQREENSLYTGQYSYDEQGRLSKIYRTFRIDNVRCSTVIMQRVKKSIQVK
jgi:hypothetical protein